MNQVNMIDDKESDERYQIGGNEEEKLNTDIEVLKLRELVSKRYVDNFEKESGEKNRMDMRDEERVTDDIEVLKLRKLISQKNMDNIEKNLIRVII